MPTASSSRSMKAAGHRVKLGIEVDYLPGREDRIAALIEGRPWDYVIGSVHFIEEGAVDHDGYDAWAAAGRTECGPTTSGPWARRPGPASSTCSRISTSSRSGVPGGPHPPATHGRSMSWLWKASPIRMWRSRYPLRDCASPRARSIPHARCSTCAPRRAGRFALSSDAHEPEYLGYEYETALGFLRRGGHLAALRLRPPPANPGAARVTVETRVGIGYDCHRFAGARTLVLGGVEFPGRAGARGPLRCGRAHARRHGCRARRGGARRHRPPLSGRRSPLQRRGQHRAAFGGHLDGS